MRRLNDNEFQICNHVRADYGGAKAKCRNGENVKLLDNVEIRTNNDGGVKEEGIEEA